MFRGLGGGAALLSRIKENTLRMVLGKTGTKARTYFCIREHSSKLRVPMEHHCKMVNISHNLDRL